VLTEAFYRDMIISLLTSEKTITTVFVGHVTSNPCLLVGVLRARTKFGTGILFFIGDYLFPTFHNPLEDLNIYINHYYYNY